LTFCIGSEGRSHQLRPSRGRTPSLTRKARTRLNSSCASPRSDRTRSCLLGNPQQRPVPSPGGT
jgi:hypothetical protein